MQNKRLLTIFGIVFIDLLGFSLILPLLPYYAKTFGADDFIAGILIASYAVAQLIGAPLLGRLSDRYGRRPILLVSIFGTFLGFLLLGFAGALWMLFVSRIVDGLTGGNLTVVQAYITDVTDQKNRAKGLGMIGAAFGLGFIIGPAVGGGLSTFGYNVPAFVAAALSFLNLIGVLLWLPESLTEERRAAMALQKRPAFTLGALWQALNRPRVGPLLHTRFFFSLAFATLQSIFGLYALARFGLEAQSTGLILAYIGVLSVLVQGFGIAWMTKRFSEKNLIFVGSIIMTLGLLGWAFAPNIPLLLIAMTPIALAGGTMNTVLSSALTKSVYPEEIGGTLGLATSVESVTRIISPIMGGFLLEKFSSSAPGIVSALIMVWVISFIWRRLIVNPDPPLPTRGAPAMNANASGD